MGKVESGGTSPEDASNVIPNSSVASHPQFWSIFPCLALPGPTHKAFQPGTG